MRRAGGKRSYPMVAKTAPAKKKSSKAKKSASVPKVKKEAGKAPGNKVVKPWKKWLTALAGKERKIPFLPLFTVWILAVIILVSLIHWEDNSTRASLRRTQDILRSFLPSKDDDTKTDKSSHRTASIPETATVSKKDVTAKNTVPDPSTIPPPASPSSEEKGIIAGFFEDTDFPSLLPVPSVEPLPLPSDPFKALSTAPVETLPQPSKEPNADIQKQVISKPDSPKADQVPSLTLAANTQEFKPEASSTDSTQDVRPSTKPPLARVAIVIDDFGLSLETAQKFAALPFPITFSILPHQAHSREIASLAHSQGREVLLHLPMEPKGYPKVNPGSNALLLSMSDSSIRETLQTAIDSHPYISGVNNHMGSQFTESEDAMRVVLRELNKKGLYFLDSYTSAQSKGHSLAKKLHIPSRQRDIFLDHVVTESSVRSQIEQLIRKAKIQGTAIAIGHPHPATLRMLRQNAKRFEEENIEVVSLGTLVKDSSK